MRFVSMLILTAMVACCNGCNRKRNLSDIPIKPNLTMDEYEDLVGTPSRIGNSNHWIGYNLKSGGELRLFFFNGPREGPRTLSQALVFNAMGNIVQRVYEMPAATQPATHPVEPTTADVNPKSESPKSESNPNAK
ncbi:MAG TPA: hypothetical protein VFC46_08740 [Humisphaera sp.]|nr:hypothetical protein [Humisphaera sp.]